MDITTYAADGITVLESFTDFVTFTPNTFSLTLNLIGREQTDTEDKYSILELIFTPVVNVYSGEETSWAKEKGFLEIVFRTGDWKSDLGKNVQDNTTISCLGIQGILPSMANKKK